jgi:hypothetical protein
LLHSVENVFSFSKNSKSSVAISVRALGEVIVGGKAFKAGFFLMKLRSSFRHIGYSLVVSDIKGISLRLGNLSHLVLHFHFLEL